MFVVGRAGMGGDGEEEDRVRDAISFIALYF